MASFWQNKTEMTGFDDRKNALNSIISISVSCATNETKIEQANALNSQNELEKAYDIYKSILGKDPMHADALFGIGTILKKQKKFDLATQFLSKAIESNPDKTQALLTRGRILRLQGMSENAISDFTEVIARHPDNFEALIARGIAFGQTSQFDMAIADFSSAIGINSNHADAFYNRGVAYEKLHEYKAAIKDYSIALKINPYDYKAYNNRGNARRKTKYFKAALKDFEKSVAINPDFAEGYYNKSLALWSAGNLRECFKLYEYRWKTAHFQSQVRNFSQPLWLGIEDLADKTILLHSEQGLGDSIQFCRYIKFFKNFDCTVLLEVELPLTHLMECLLPRHQIFQKGSTLPSFDFHCPLMSLPLAFSTNARTIPFPESYLFANFEEVKRLKLYLGQTQKTKVGICWRGNSKHVNDYKRSMKLSSIIDLLDGNFTWVSLQYDADKYEQELIEKNKNFTESDSEMENFAKTAALCEALDVIISVDTSVAHLAGALGKKVFLLLPDVADARWCTTGTTTQWYHNTTLIRQQEQFNWRPPIQHAKKLAKFQTEI